jgi:phospholipase/carboxylesterase
MRGELALFRHIWLPQAGATRTVVALHGTGGDEHDLLPLVEAWPTRVNFLGLRGNVLERGQARFFKRFAEGQFDEADMRQQAADLWRFWAAAQESYSLAEATTTWLGYSNGANMIAALLLLSEVVHDAVLLRAQAVLREPPAPSQPKHGTVRLLSGALDPIVPAAESLRLGASLTAQGYALDHQVLQAGHGLGAEDLRRLQG